MEDNVPHALEQLQKAFLSNARPGVSAKEGGMRLVALPVT